MRLIRALEDVGVNGLMVGRRRYAFLSNESTQSVERVFKIGTGAVYHFGSMSEGTTTPGMGSDIDTLKCNDDVNIMTGWPEWERGRMNLLMVKHGTCSPQHYRLQMADSILPIPLTVPLDEYCVPDDDGTIFFSNTFFEDSCRLFFAANNLPHVRTGPSNSFSEMFDQVYAFRCRKLPAECDSWFTRERSGDWPTPDIFQAARELGCFLIPDGHCDSVHSSVEWRVSPSLIERHLMFSMDLINIQCYVAMKLLKKDIIKPFLNGRGKLTSFHCKTALFYAKEELPQSLWKVDRLFDCIIYCLKLLRFWTLKGHCPHYIMDTVNLFDGKLNMEERQYLYEILTIIIDTHLAPLAFIETDHLGDRLLHNVYTVAIWDMTPRRVVHQQISGFLSVFSNYIKMNTLRELLNLVVDCLPDELCLRLHHMVNELPLQQLSRTGSEQSLNRLDDVNRDCIVRYLCQHLASTAASICIQHGLQIGDRIWTWYSMSMNTDLASSRLKMASMFYCKGDLQLAVEVLEDVERRYDDKVQAMCGCGRMGSVNTQIYISTTSFTESLNECNDVLSTDNIAFCVRFLRQEIFCAPPILHYEMIRAVGDAIPQRDYIERQWMDWAVVDSRPFLHYLQYLTFRGLGIRPRQQQALDALSRNVTDGIRRHQVFHQETAMNLLAHCWEMDNDPEPALALYLVSQAKVPRNNAANWHIHRLTSGQ